MMHPRAAAGFVQGALAAAREGVEQRGSSGRVAGVAERPGGMHGDGHGRVEAGRRGAQAVGTETAQGAAQGPSDGREVALASEEVAEGIGGAGAGKTPYGADEGFERFGASLVREATEEGVEGVVGGERGEGRGGAAAEPLVGVVQGGVEVVQGGVVAGPSRASAALRRACLSPP